MARLPGCGRKRPGGCRHSVPFGPAGSGSAYGHRRFGNRCGKQHRPHCGPGGIAGCGGRGQGLRRPAGGRGPEKRRGQRLCAEHRRQHPLHWHQARRQRLDHWGPGPGGPGPICGQSAALRRVLRDLRQLRAVFHRGRGALPPHHRPGHPNARRIFLLGNGSDRGQRSGGALSTALFCMPYEDGLALVEKIGGVEVLWITADGTQYRTDGLPLL